MKAVEICKKGIRMFAACLDLRTRLIVLFFLAKENTAIV